MSRKPTSPKTLVTDAQEVLRTCPGIAIRAAERRVTRLLEARLQPVALGFAQFSLMVLIAAARDDTIGALAARSGLDQSTLSRTLRTLERAGLVEIAIVERDLRRRAVWLTEAGARRLEAAIPLWREARAILARVIAPATVRSLAEATRRLAAIDARTEGD